MTPADTTPAGEAVEITEAMIDAWLEGAIVGDGVTPAASVQLWRHSARAELLKAARVLALRPAPAARDAAGVRGGVELARQYLAIARKHAGRIEVEAHAPNGERPCTVADLIDSALAQIAAALTTPPPPAESAAGRHVPTLSREETATRLREWADDMLAATPPRTGALHLLDAIHYITAAPQAPAQEGAGWRPTHRHRKRGTTYRILGTARLQAARTGSVEECFALTIYEGEDGQRWAREADEFEDGRFERLDRPTPPAPGETEGSAS